jgi:hypothetical protein
MKQKYTIPSQEVICLTPTEPKEFTKANITNAIKYLRDLGVPTFRDTTEFDSEYPRLLWDGTEVTQTQSSGRPNSITVTSVDEFVALFEPTNMIEVRDISESYSAKVYAEHIEVGCQKISKEKFTELIEAAKKVGLI